MSFGEVDAELENAVVGGQNPSAAGTSAVQADSEDQRQFLINQQNQIFDLNNRREDDDNDNSR